MTPTTILWLDAFSDFVIAAGATLSGGLLEQTGGTHMPSQATWLLAVILGIVAAFKQIKARLAPPPPAK